MNRSRFFSSTETIKLTFVGQVHARKKPMAPDVDYIVVASMTDGMVGAELANIVEVAALYMMREGRTEVSYVMIGF